MRDEVHIQYILSGNTEDNFMEITNVYGEKIAEYHLTNILGEIEFNKPELSAAIYFCILRQGKQIIAVSKFVKQ